MAASLMLAETSRVEHKSMDFEKKNIQYEVATAHSSAESLLLPKELDKLAHRGNVAIYD